MARLALLVAYDGTPFAGFAENPHVETVAGSLRSAISTVLGQDIPPLVCAGRTDKGVHAAGQVVHIDLPDATLDRLGRERFLRSLNRLTHDGITIVAGRVVDADFDARFSARYRHYRYIVNTAPVLPPGAHAMWHCPNALFDIALMNEAASLLIGEHDFATFCRAQERADGTLMPTRRKVLTATWHMASVGVHPLTPPSLPTSDPIDTTMTNSLLVWPNQHVICFEVTAGSFCQQMVRSLVGCLLDVGAGKKDAAWFGELLATPNRQHVGRVAPAAGLTLLRVGYENDPFHGHDTVKV